MDTKKTRTIIKKTNYTLVIVENNNEDKINNFVNDLGRWASIDLGQNKIKIGNTLTFSFQVVSNEYEKFFGFLSDKYNDLSVVFAKTEKGGALSRYTYTPNGVEKIIA